MGNTFDVSMKKQNVSAEVEPQGYSNSVPFSPRLVSSSELIDQPKMQYDYGSHDDSPTIRGPSINNQLAQEKKTSAFQQQKELPAKLDKKEEKKKEEAGFMNFFKKLCCMATD